MSEKDLKAIIEKLKKFDLSQDEAEVYLNMPQNLALTEENIAERTGHSIDDLHEIMTSLKDKGFVKVYMDELYVPIAPIESLDKRITTLLNDLRALKEYVVTFLQPRFPQSTLFGLNVTKTQFNSLVNKLTKKATGNINISGKELKFIDETDFISILEKNKRLRANSAQILLTANENTPEWGDIVSRTRKLTKSNRVWMKYNPSRTNIRYMTVQIEDKLIVLLVDPEHQHAIQIENNEVATIFDDNFGVYFRQGKPISVVLDPVKDIKNPQTMDDEVLKRLKERGVFETSVQI